MDKVTAPCTLLCKVELTDYSGEVFEDSISYHTSYEDAKRIATALSKMYYHDPYRYLVTTDNDNIRVYDKEEDKVKALICLSKHKFVEVG